MAMPIAHVWKPSTARSVTLDAFVPVPRGATPSIPTPASWPSKDPQDVLDYQVDVAPALIGNSEDSIVSASISISPSNPGDLNLVNSVADGSRVILWFSAGRPGTIYIVTLAITTDSGRVIQRSIQLPVLDLSSPQAAINALSTSGGLPITDQNGNPVLIF